MRTVALVLSLLTRLVSPQCHIRADTKFQTLCKAFDNRFPRSQWQDKCHFTWNDKQDKQQVQDKVMPPPEGAEPLTDKSAPTANDETGQDDMQDAMSRLLSQHPIILPQQETPVPTRTNQAQRTSQDMMDSINPSDSIAQCDVTSRRCWQPNSWSNKDHMTSPMRSWG